MDNNSQSSGRWGWVIGIACVILVILALNRHSQSSPPAGPTGNVERVPDATSVDPATDAPRPEHSPSTFAGYDCTQDCSGHEAGYKWAEEHDIDNEDDCEMAGDTSDSPSFAEGCKAYVNGESLAKMMIMTTEGILMTTRRPMCRVCNL